MIPSITFFGCIQVKYYLRVDHLDTKSYQIHSKLLRRKKRPNKDKYYCTTEIQKQMTLHKCKEESVELVLHFFFHGHSDADLHEIQFDLSTHRVAVALVIKNVRENNITLVRVKCVHIISFLVGR